MSLKNQAISGIRWTTVGTIGRSVFQLLQVAILTRFLPKEAFGLVAMALFVVQFSNIFVDMGLTSAILHRQDATQKEYSSIYWFNIFISIALYAIVFAVTPFVSKFYNEPELIKLVPILGINILLIASGRQHRTIMQKQLKFKTIAITELISYFVGLISAVYFAISNYGVYSLVYSTLLSSFISNLLFLYKNVKNNPISLHFSIEETKPFLKIGGYTMGSTLLDFFSREVDVLIIGKLLGADNLGVYSLAKQIVLKLYGIVNPIVVSVLTPLLSSIQKEKARLKQSYLKTIKYLAYINAPIYLFLILLSKETLTILYGESYADSYLILSFMAFSYYLVSIGNPVGSLQIATGRTDLGFKWTIIRILITPLVIFLGALINIETVAIFYALLLLILIMPNWLILIKPMINIKLKEYISYFYKPIILLLIVLLLVYMLGVVITNNIIIDIITKICFVLIIYGSFMFISDKKLLSEIYSLIMPDLNKK